MINKNMINLLPKEIKEKNFKSYQKSVLTVCLFTLSVVVIVSTMTLLPAYFTALVHERVEIENLTFFEQRPESQESSGLSEIIKSTNKDMSVFQERESVALFRSVIDPVLQTERSGIRIKDFLLYLEDDTYQGEIHGLAESREDLEIFANLLAEREEFSSVDVPISQYAKGKDIDFSITFTIK